MTGDYEIHSAKEVEILEISPHPSPKMKGFMVVRVIVCPQHIVRWMWLDMVVPVGALVNYERMT
jgi:hypothetical protein